MRRRLALAGISLLAAGCIATRGGGPANNEFPTAVIDGANATYPVATTADFDGSASSEAGDQITGYAWFVAAQPEGSTTKILATPGAPDHASLFLDVTGVYEVGLEVTDSHQATGVTLIDFLVTNSAAMAAEGS